MSEMSRNSVETRGGWADLELIGGEASDADMYQQLEGGRAALAVNQDGLVISMTLDMDYETPVPEALTAVPFNPPFFVGYFLVGEALQPIVGSAPPIAGVMQGVDGRQYEHIVKHERFHALKHGVDDFTFNMAAYGVRRGLPRELKAFSDEMQRESGISLAQAVTLTQALSTLTAQHSLLQEIADRGEPLSEAQLNAEAEISVRLMDLVQGVPNLSGVQLNHRTGPPLSTVSLLVGPVNDSDSDVSLGIPVDPVQRAEMAGRPFWDDYVRRVMVLELQTDSAAFQDLGIAAEAARITRAASLDLERGGSDWTRTLYDFNGKAVGRLDCLAQLPADPVSAGSLRLTMVLPPLSVGWTRPNYEAQASVLDAVAQRLEAGETDFKVSNEAGELVLTLETRPAEPNLEVQRDADASGAAGWH